LSWFDFLQASQFRQRDLLGLVTFFQLAADPIPIARRRALATYLRNGRTRKLSFHCSHAGTFSARRASIAQRYAVGSCALLETTTSSAMRLHPQQQRGKPSRYNSAPVSRRRRSSSARRRRKTLFGMFVERRRICSPFWLRRNW
jgi:hypothetical protein